MTYSKPAIAVLGDAASVIQGGKVQSHDIAPGLFAADCELDD